MAEVLVIGAGPAGLSAALVAAQGGARVALADLNPAPGGQIWRAARNGPAGRLIRAALAHPNLTWLPGARAVSVEDERTIRFSTPAGARLINADRIILATGATELFLPFPGWTLPGVVGAGGAQALLKGGLEVRGLRALVAGSGPLLLAAASALRAHGATVLGIAEQAPAHRLAGFGWQLARDPARIRAAAGLAYQLRGVPYWMNAFPVQAHGVHQLEAVTLRHGGRERRVELDLLACGFGLVPDVRLAQALSCPLTPDGAVRVDAWGRTGTPGIFAIGECTGVGGVDQARAQGYVAGCAVTGQTERAHPFLAARADHLAFARTLARTFAPRPELRGLADSSTIVCRCEDVTHGELRQRHGWTEAKLHTRCGMGACQGRVCGPAAQVLYGWDKVGARPPLSPVPIGQLFE